MGVFEDTSIRILGVHREKRISLGYGRKKESFGSRCIQQILRVHSYATNSERYVLVSGNPRYKKNEIVQNSNWNYIDGTAWNNPDLTDDENDEIIGNLPIVDDNPQE